MSRPLLILLAALVVAGCSSPLATLTTRPPGAFASATEVAQGGGYVDPEGRLAIAPVYQRTQAFRNRLALVYRGARALPIGHDGAPVGPSEL